MLERRRDELLDALASAYAEDLLSEEQYERLVGGAVTATRDEELRRIADVILERVRRRAPRPVRSPPPPTPEAHDVAGVIRAFYDVISWRFKRPPSLEALAALAAPHARFIQGGEDLDLHGFWRRRGGHWTTRTLLPFAQRELDARNSIYGDLAHRLSLYEATAADGSRVGRGVNSFQLTREDARWVIRSVAWEEAHEDGDLDGWPARSCSR